MHLKIFFLNSCNFFFIFYIIYYEGALQVDKRDSSQTDDDYCFVVGSYSESTTTMTLLNADDPTQGLSLTYFGDRCNHPPAQRKFTIELTCAGW